MAETRPPVVGIFGHIDHGKSTLLEYIRKTNITKKEAGGITQHIAAYEVIHKGSDGSESRITFLDTPGHEAFQSIRTKGASAADIAILVVSAEDGVKPQTLEALKHIKSTEIPFMVAITKIDKPSADVDRTKQNLAENDVYVEGYGGNVSVAAVSAKTGEGVDDLLETLVLMAGLEAFEARADEPGKGVIIESKLDSKKGVTATGVIKGGTVRRGMFAAAGGALAPLRFIENAEGENVDEASFSSPIQISGWSSMPHPGDEFRTFLKKDDAEKYAEETAHEESALDEALPEGMATLPVVIKADTAGSLDAVAHELKKLRRERIAPLVIHKGVGAISESDIKGAQTTEGVVILGFNTKMDSRAKALSERAEIKVLVSNIIYELTKEVENILREREPKEEVEEVIGKAKIIKIFSVTKDKQVLGGKVIQGNLKKGASVKLIRRESEIGSGKVKELQQSKVAVESVGEENEFGALVESKIEIAPGDILESVARFMK